MVINSFELDTFTLEQATTLVNESFQSGYFTINGVSMTVDEVVDMYNSNNETNISVSKKYISSNLFEQKYINNHSNTNFYSQLLCVHKLHQT